VDEVAQQLDGVLDSKLFIKYILWLAHRAPDKALSVSLLARGACSVLKPSCCLPRIRKLESSSKTRQSSAI
jgi:hypothetical protein